MFTQFYILTWTMISLYFLFIQLNFICCKYTVQQVHVLIFRSGCNNNWTYWLFIPPIRTMGSDYILVEIPFCSNAHCQVVTTYLSIDITRSFVWLLVFQLANYKKCLPMADFVTHLLGNAYTEHVKI